MLKNRLMPLDAKRTVLILAALFCGGAVPINLLTVSFGYAQYVKGLNLVPDAVPTAHTFAANIYIPWLVVPALIVLIGIALYCRPYYPDIYRRIWVGAASGAVATIALDAVRLTGVVHGWLPGDTPVVFGRLITGSEVFSTYYPTGVAAHYLFGADLGIFYTFVWGKRSGYRAALFWAVVWALLVELGMMTLPPMAPFVGPFGIRFAWPQLFILTLTAHVVWGIALGWFAQQFLGEEDRGGFLQFLGTVAKSPIQTRSEAA